MQLFSITHEMCQSFDKIFEVRSIFRYISKAFEKIWHKGLILKLKTNGVTGDFKLNIVIDFLKERNKEWPLIASILNSPMFLQRFRRARSLDHIFHSLY